MRHSALAKTQPIPPMASPGSVALDLNANEYLSSIAFALLYYDYTLTFEIEVDRFWTPKFTSASYLFYLNRYLGISGHIPVILQLFRAFSNKTCIQLQSYHQILSVVVQVVVGTCLIVRTYALYERARWVLWFLCSLALGVIAVGCWAITGKHTNPVPIQDIGCNTTLSPEQGIHLAIAWGGMTTFDLVLFVLTILKSLRMARIGRRTLVDVILQDGAMYFCFMVLANIANISTFVLGGPLLRGAPSTFTNVVSVTLISRLMLNLRDPSLRAPLSLRTPLRSAAGDSSAADHSTRSIVFASAAVYDDEIELLPQTRSMLGKLRE